MAPPVVIARSHPPRLAAGRQSVPAARAEAMHTAHVDKPEGRRYNQEISYLLKANGLDDIGKADRSKLLFILDNIVEVERWLATVPANKQLKLNHPHTIWRAYKASVKKPDSTTPKRLSPTEKLKQGIRFA